LPYKMPGKEIRTQHNHKNVRRPRRGTFANISSDQ
jgi:hypothetical protein